MAITIAANLSYQGRLPNFERDSFDTLADMKSFPETSLDDGHISYCKETKDTYKYRSDNTEDERTGKWRLFNSGLIINQIDLSSVVTYAIPENNSLTEEVVYYFTTGNDVTGCSITLASENMKWCNGIEISSISTNKTYVVSVLNNMVVWGEF